MSSMELDARPACKEGPLQLSDASLHKHGDALARAGADAPTRT